MGSEMCIRDRDGENPGKDDALSPDPADGSNALGGSDSENCASDGCLLYTSDAADERSSVDLGGRRIIKKKQRLNHGVGRHQIENE